MSVGRWFAKPLRKPHKRPIWRTQIGPSVSLTCNCCWLTDCCFKQFSSSSGSLGFCLCYRSPFHLWLPWSFPELFYIWDSLRLVLEMQLWGIRQGFSCQGMTHNNALKTQWIKTVSSQIDSIFLWVCTRVCVKFSIATLLAKFKRAPPNYCL